MRAFVSRGQSHRACILCRRTIKRGQVGFSHMPSRGGGAIYWHRSCLEELLATSPDDDQTVAVNRKVITEGLTSGTLNLLLSESPRDA